MNAIKNLKIRTRLLGAFLITALITLLIGLLGLTKSTQINDMLNSMYDNNLVPIADVANANMQVIYHNRELYHFIVEAEKSGMDKIKASLAANETGMAKLIDHYRKTDLTAKEKELLIKFDAAWKVYAANAERVMKLSYADQNKEAMALMNGDTSAHFKAADDLLTEIVTLNQALAKTAYDESDAVVAQIRMVVISSIVAALQGGTRRPTDGSRLPGSQPADAVGGPFPGRGHPKSVGLDRVVPIGPADGAARGLGTRLSGALQAAGQPG